MKIVIIIILALQCIVSKNKNYNATDKEMEREMEIRLQNPNNYVSPIARELNIIFPKELKTVEIFCDANFKILPILNYSWHIITTGSNSTMWRKFYFCNFINKKVSSFVINIHRPEIDKGTEQFIIGSKGHFDRIEGCLVSIYPHNHIPPGRKDPKSFVDFQSDIYRTGYASLRLKVLESLRDSGFCKKHKSTCYFFCDLAKNVSCRSRKCDLQRYAEEEYH